MDDVPYMFTKQRGWYSIKYYHIGISAHVVCIHAWLVRIHNSPPNSCGLLLCKVRTKSTFPD